MTSRDTVLTSPYLRRELLLEPNFDETISLCQTDKLSASICRNESFWAEKAQRKLGINRDHFYDTLLSPDWRYLELAIGLGRDFSKKSRFLLKEEVFIEKSIQFGYDLPEDIINDTNNHRWILRCAVEFNKIQPFLIYLGKTMNFQIAAAGALRGGHSNLFRSIKLLAPTRYPWIYRLLLRDAIEGGNRRLIEHIRSRIVGIYDASLNQDILDAASLSKDPTIIDYVISNILPANYVINWQAIGDRVASAGSRNNLAYILPRYNNWDWNELAEAAIPQAPNPDLGKIELVLASAPKGYGWDYNRLASEALIKHQLYMFKLLYSMAPIDYPWDLEQMDVPYDDIRIVTAVFSIMKRIPVSELNWNEIIIRAVRLMAQDGIRHGLDQIINAAPENYQWDKQAILEATGGEDELRDMLAPILLR